MDTQPPGPYSYLHFPFICPGLPQHPNLNVCLLACALRSVFRRFSGNLLDTFFWCAKSPAVLLTHWAVACCLSSPPSCISKLLLHQTNASSRCSSWGPQRRRSGAMCVLCCFVNKSMLSATSNCHERLGINGGDCLSHWRLYERGYQSCTVPCLPKSEWCVVIRS